MNREQKKVLRADIFRHLDGIVTAPVAYALHRKGVLDALLAQGKVALEDLATAFSANSGYLNAALRVLASQGWIDYAIDSSEQVTVSVNEKTAEAVDHIPIYKDVIELLEFSGDFHARKFEIDPFLRLEKIFHRYQDQYGLDAQNIQDTDSVSYQVLKHIEGHIVGPSTVALGMSGMFHKYFMDASFRPEEFHEDEEHFGRLLNIFTGLGWFTKTGDTFRFTDKGLFFAKRASAYGVTVSYIPMFRKINDLLFGNPSILWERPVGSKEIHVDREMNVWGSGGAHSSYFKVVDEIIIDVFNRPIDEQPKGILDMGCGNGAFLIHLFNVIAHKTLRGQLLEEHPLFLVGADYNKAALSVTRKNIIQSDIWAKVVFGDISRPDILADDLLKNYNIKLSDLLNTRTFLDHNRIWSDPTSASDTPHAASTGAFAFRGRRLPGALVAQNLKEHFIRWKPYVSRYGLLVIELHTISPGITAQHLGQTAATAYDATHGFSDQYILEIDAFHEAAEQAGLRSVTKHFTKFPDSEIATVSIQLFKSTH